MNLKEAKEIVHFARNESSVTGYVLTPKDPGAVARAKGYLEAIEQMKPVIEKIEILIKQIFGVRLLW